MLNSPPIGHSINGWGKLCRHGQRGSIRTIRFADTTNTPAYARFGINGQPYGGGPPRASVNPPRVGYLRNAAFWAAHGAKSR